VTPNVIKIELLLTFKLLKEKDRRVRVLSGYCEYCKIKSKNALCC